MILGNRKKYIALAFIPVSIGILCFFIIQKNYSAPTLKSEEHAAGKDVEFPNIDVTQLSQSQRKLVGILKEEYQAQPSGTKYSQGVSEPWCADFVSWAFKESGTPLLNPNSKSWRIPGTATLRDYYKSKGKFRLANSGYSPKVGDIMLYEDPSPFGHHTNIVLKNDNGVITTIGGNEYGKIRVSEHGLTDSTGFIGYGVF